MTKHVIDFSTDPHTSSSEHVVSINVNVDNQSHHLSASTAAITGLFLFTGSTLEHLAS